ncbi:hypothetical protein BGZ63DRAFT_397666 [Mariannaea sp. PMI_226]|nr:hypothetical protein BGZ63DRAFT_397666 [Mariannaea sp. PMI_226]
MDMTWYRMRNATRAGVARITVPRIKSIMSPKRSLVRASTLFLPYQLTSTWRQVWSKMFRNDDWHRYLEKIELMPTLVGVDLHLLSGDDQLTPKYLALAVPRNSNEVAISMDLFFCSLTEHTYDAVLDEVTFTDCNTVVNIRSLRTSGKVLMKDPALLFSQIQPLTLAILSYESEARLKDMRPGSFGGLCKGLPRSSTDIHDVCSVMLKGKGETTVYQVFERIGCPPVREITATYLGEKIGPWRFEVKNSGVVEI